MREPREPAHPPSPASPRTRVPFVLSFMPFVPSVVPFLVPFLVFFVVLLVGLFAPLDSAHAQDGQAIVVTGRVMRERLSPGVYSYAELGVGDEIRGGDLIRTSRDGRLQIRFSDGSIVSLQPGTVFRIEEYRFDEGDQRAFYVLLRGALRTITGAIGKTRHDDYRMKTPTATLGVRGTEYVAEQTVCDPDCAPGPRAGLRVAVAQGRVVLTTLAGALEIGAGQSAAVESADAPPRGTDSGPVVPPISSTAPRERAPGPPAVARTSPPAGLPTPAGPFPPSGAPVDSRAGAEPPPSRGADAFDTGARQSAETSMLFAD